ncbi:MAG: ABC transporter permease [Candidatus Methanodesulfokora sp.]|jgi:peptide/nickel transport system permease protein|nr:MAG: ABC transporter permease [Candidatus Korarchaeota archaeon]
MRWSDLKADLLDFWFQFVKNKSGMLGLILLIFFIILAIAAPIIAPEAGENWRNLEYWQENPKSVPPAWINIFSSKKLFVHSIIYINKFNVTSYGGITEYVYNISLDYNYDVPPAGMLLVVNAKGKQSPITLDVQFTRPDGTSLRLASEQLYPVSKEDLLEYSLHFGSDMSVVSNVMDFARKYENPDVMSKIKPDVFKFTYPLFSKAKPGLTQEGAAEPLKGRYIITITIFTTEQGIEVTGARMVLEGQSYGLFGTDDFRRDLFQGLMWGTQVSLLVGVVASVVSVLIGVLYGVTSAYLGGRKEELMQRITEIFYNIPMLPLAIMLAALLTPSIWNVVLILVVFGWSGYEFVVRSIAHQVKEMDYIEASRAIGARARRIITRHIMPQIAPYAFASIALGVPGAILTEAALSFLGLADIKRVTWGLILHDANGAAATIRGMWWWVVPPGLFIALLGLSFVLIGTALDEILNPKMRKL